MLTEEQNKKLQQLQDALEAGILTKEEYETKRKEILPPENEMKNSNNDGFFHYSAEPTAFDDTCKAKENSQVPNDDGVVYFHENYESQSGQTDPDASNNRNDSNFGQMPRKKKNGFFTGIKNFWTRNKRNKILTIIGVILIVVILSGSIKSCSHESYDWPDNDMANMIPKPEGTITYLSTSAGSHISADVKTNEKSYMIYVKACKKKGFTEEKDESRIEESCYYSAKNNEGYSLSVNYDGKQMSISLHAPKDEEPTTQATSSTESSTTSTSSDFKSTMDSYEAFMNKYVDFMKKYENSNDTAGMLSEYSEMMKEYSEFTKKVDAIDEDSLSESDYAYYMEVMNRVNKKLLEVT